MKGLQLEQAIWKRLPHAIIRGEGVPQRSFNPQIQGATGKHEAWKNAQTGKPATWKLRQILMTCMTPHLEC